MSITLDTLTLPDELVWSDYDSWDTVRHIAKRSVLGKRIISESTYTSDSGRPITLVGDTDGWITRTDLDTLNTWKNTSGKEMTLTLHDSSTYNVRFRLIDSPVIQAETLTGTAYPISTTVYTVTIKLEVI